MKGIFVHVELRVHHRRVGCALAQQRWTGEGSHDEACVSCVECLKAFGSMKVVVISEETNVLDLEEYAEQLQNCFNIWRVRLDPEGKV